MRCCHKASDQAAVAAVRIKVPAAVVIAMSRAMRSRQWSCSELEQGNAKLLAVKKEQPADEQLEEELEKDRDALACAGHLCLENYTSRCMTLQGICMHSRCRQLAAFEVSLIT